jgi:hypothetical protein
MKIIVTQEDIDKGLKNSCSSRPVALAVQRVFPDKRISVSGMIYIDYYEYWYPSNVNVFIRRFDRGALVQPFSFELCL